MATRFCIGFVILVCFTCCYESSQVLTSGRKARENILKRLENINSIEEFEKAFNIKNPKRSYLKKRGNLFLGNLLDDVAPLAYGSPRPCVPKETVYTIPHVPARDRYIPDCLNVTRCGGCCSSFKTSADMECVADQTESKMARVYHFDKFTGGYSQKVIPYVNHKSCKCQCKTQPEDCNLQQTYDPNHCKCNCNIKSATCPKFMEWSVLACQCKCKPPSTPCAPTHAWNDQTCQCDCIPRACAQGYGFDVKKCTCAKLQV
ncbi:vascular endothelial growth factor A-like [Clytia hemisphaerica]|uniref:Platelet-derived growth factor (PDGF) family profile domain-containing protein n=1 Tax=Clytia hemisphaerica TaxID=252671 RepID=A0A7M5XE60_9CNID|eukprot:TCONS_00055556-protein